MLLENAKVSSLLAGIVSMDCKLTGISLVLSSFARKWNFLKKIIINYKSIHDLIVKLRYKKTNKFYRYMTSKFRMLNSTSLGII